MQCPNCSSEHIKKNGYIHNGKQRYACCECKRQFVAYPQNKPISDETKALIDKLLLERLSLRAIARVTSVSLTWLQNYVNEKYKNIPKEVNVSTKKKGPITIECDELWSYVHNKNNKQWVWLAIDRAVKLLVFTLVIGTSLVLMAYGILFLLFTVSALFLLLTFGRLIRQFFHLKDIMLLVKKQEKPLILKG